MNWFVCLSGEESVMDMISALIPEELIRRIPDGEYLLFFDSGTGLSNEGEVLQDAGEKIAVIRGISRLVLNADPEIKIERISPVNTDWTDVVVSAPAEKEEGIIISCDGEGEEEEIAIKNPFESVYQLASSDRCLEAAIKYLGADYGTWEGFLQIFRKIESCAGDPSSKGWCSEDTQAWFLDSAEAMTSENAVEEQDLCTPMYLSEAESFIIILMQEWIKEKKRNAMD